MNRRTEREVIESLLNDLNVYLDGDNNIFLNEREDDSWTEYKLTFDNKDNFIAAVEIDHY